MNRITTIPTLKQHNNPTAIHNADATSLKALQGVQKDFTCNGVTCKENDFIAARVDTPVVPFFMVDVQMVAGDRPSAAWQVYFSASAENPAPLGPNFVVARNGAYAGLYSTPGKNPQASYDPNGAPVYLIIQALQDQHNGHIHVVRNG
jgi:hypothetical protein